VRWPGSTHAHADVRTSGPHGYARDPEVPMSGPPTIGVVRVVLGCAEEQEVAASAPMSLTAY
jgi:hypothetical protein